MITFVRRAKRRYNCRQDEKDKWLDIEISYSIFHRCWYFSLRRSYHTHELHHGYDSAEEAMDAVSYRVEQDYRIMDPTDLELEKALLEAFGGDDGIE